MRGKRESYRENGHARAYLLRIADRLVCDRNRKGRPEITVNGVDWRTLEPSNRDGDPLHKLSLQRDGGVEQGHATPFARPAPRAAFAILRTDEFYGNRRRTRLPAGHGAKPLPAQVGIAPHVIGGEAENGDWLRAEDRRPREKKLTARCLSPFSTGETS